MKKFLTIVILLLISNIAYSGWFSSEGKLRISSNKEGADIFVDGVKKAQTSNGYTTITVAEGDHQIRITKDDDEWYYYEANKNIFVGKNTETEISMRLQRKLTITGRLREEEKQKQLDIEDSLFYSGQYKKYLKSCKYCKKEAQAKKEFDDYLLNMYWMNKSFSTATDYIENCLSCRSKNKFLGKLAFLKDLDQNYKDNNNGTITNKILKITWMKCKLGNKWNGTTCNNSYYRVANELEFDWKSIKAGIKKLNKKGYAGKKDWRLPTFKELKSILFCKNGKIENSPPFCKGKISRAYNEMAFPSLVENSSNFTAFWSAKDSGGKIKSIQFSSIRDSLFSKTKGAGAIIKGVSKDSGWGRWHNIILVRSSQ